MGDSGPILVRAPSEPVIGFVLYTGQTTGYGKGHDPQGAIVALAGVQYTPGRPPFGRNTLKIQGAAACPRPE